MLSMQCLQRASGVIMLQGDGDAPSLDPPKKPPPLHRPAEVSDPVRPPCDPRNHRGVVDEIAGQISRAKNPRVGSPLVVRRSRPSSASY